MIQKLLLFHPGVTRRYLALPRSPGCGKQTAGCPGKRHRALCGGPARSHGSTQRRGSCGSGGLELSESLGARDGLGWAGLASGFELESELEMLVMVCQGFKALKQLAMTLSSLSLRVGLLLKFQFMFSTLDPFALIACTTPMFRSWVPVW